MYIYIYIYIYKFNVLITCKVNSSKLLRPSSLPKVKMKRKKNPE